VGEFVDQHDLGPPGENAVHVQLGELCPAVLHHPPWHHLQAVEQGLRPGPAVRLDQTDDHVGAALEPAVRLVEHRVRLAHARRRAQVDAQLSPARPGRRRVRRRPGRARRQLLGSHDRVFIR